jgi:hypothetical protein
MAKDNKSFGGGLILMGIASALAFGRDYIATQLFGGCQAVQQCAWYNIFCKAPNYVGDAVCVAQKSVFGTWAIIIAAVIFMIGLYKLVTRV